MDLGSGGGVPGLVLAWHRPQIRWTLLDGSQRRGAFLTEAVADLDLGGCVDVVPERAEIAGRGSLRHTQDLVVARGFAGPAVTAECAAPLLAVGGRLVVSEPPGGAPERWPAQVLRTLGLVPHRAVASPIALQVLRQTEPCPDRYPRRVGVPGKHPLF
ncbi:MAG: RsmG family class I SAM-dependent methyltransferase [Acidimicrobiales bacterium]